MQDLLQLSSVCFGQALGRAADNGKWLARGLARH